MALKHMPETSERTTYSDKIRKASSLSAGFSKISPFIAMIVSALIITGAVYTEPQLF